MAVPAARPSNTSLKVARKGHVWLGLGTALVLAVSATTGIYLNHKDLFTPGGETISRQKPTKAMARLGTAAEGEVISPALALQVARTSWGEVPLEHVQLKQEGNGLAWRIKGTDGRELHVDATDGRVLYQRGPKANNALNKVLHDLHTGEIVALPGRLLIDAGGLGMLILSGTGIFVWWTPRRRKVERARQQGTLVQQGGASGTPRPVQAEPAPGTP